MKKPKIIRKEELKENDYGNTKVTDILNEEELKFSVAKVRKIGNDVKIGYNTESDVAYYVLGGKGNCVINGKRYTLKKGDLVFCPKGTKYSINGLTLLVISSPKFDRNKRRYVK